MTGSTTAISRFLSRPATRLATIVAIALMVRVGYLVYIRGTFGFEWIDPDDYASRGRLLFNGNGAWQWTIEAVRYSGPFFKAPLYPLFLTLFFHSPFGYLWSAALVQAAFDAVCVAALWSLGRDLHSEKAGLIAAGVYALVLPGGDVARYLHAGAGWTCRS